MLGKIKFDGRHNETNSTNNKSSSDEDDDAELNRIHIGTKAQLLPFLLLLFKQAKISILTNNNNNNKK